MATVEHVLYVRMEPPGGDPGARARTIETLQWFDSNIAGVRALGVRLRVERVSAEALADPAIVARLASAGVTSLPALWTPARTWLGLAAIAGLYADRARSAPQRPAPPPASAGRGTGRGAGRGAGRSQPAPAAVDDAENALEEWRTAELAGGSTTSGGNDDDDDDGGNPGKQLMADYNKQMMLRNKMAPGRGRAPNSSGGDPPGEPPSSAPARARTQPASQSGQSGRTSPPRSGRASDAASDAWAHLRSAPPGDGEDPPDPRDDQMVQALLDNLED